MRGKPAQGSKCMTTKTNTESKKNKLQSLMAQAREGLKFAELLAKPALENGREKTNAKIKASLKALGLATKAEVKQLEERVKKLEAELNKLKA
jgi:polyhydroxyalkanoate synthesis regulator phasin